MTYNGESWQRWQEMAKDGDMKLKESRLKVYTVWHSYAPRRPITASGPQAAALTYYARLVVDYRATVNVMSEAGSIENFLIDSGGVRCHHKGI